MIAAFLVGLGAFKLKKAIKPRDQWEKPTKFSTRKYQEFLEKKKLLPMIDKYEVQKRLKKQEAYNRKFRPFIILLGLVLCGGGFYFGKEMSYVLANGLRAEGVVTGMKSDCDSDGCAYRPIVKFTDHKGKATRFEDKVGSNPPSYKRGDEVTVIYLENGDKKPIIDRGIWNWTLSVALGGIGALIIFIFLIQNARSQRRH